MSGSFVISFCLQGKELGKGRGGSGYQSESREAKRVVRWAGEADIQAGAAPCPGRGRQEAAATLSMSPFPEADALSGGRGSIFLRI